MQITIMTVPSVPFEVTFWLTVLAVSSYLWLFVAWRNFAVDGSAVTGSAVNNSRCIANTGAGDAVRQGRLAIRSMFTEPGTPHS